ncbi:midasin-like protein isoform X2 [Tasmannia lanceolata]|uniref:midasin-like protein isoform X2 n=1 Tax=Tasmannia lanceolata TaxID=3420 RepID=UPI0040635A88
MAFDGSFTCNSALQRLLTRCPNLQNNIDFTRLSQKGDELREEEIVILLAEPFLHPNYTIPILGCFRPLGRKIVEKAVALLRLVPDLKLNSDEDYVEIGEGEIDVIEFYIRIRRTLKLHELASLAFCRVLDLAPFLLGPILYYFSFAPPPFQRLLMMGPFLRQSEKDVIHLLDAVRVSFRFLLLEPKVFSELWDWSCFLELVQLLKDVTSDDDSAFFKNSLDIRWCGVQILSFILRMSDRSTVNFGLEAETAFTCFLRWEEFCQDVSLEKAGMYLEANELETGRFPEGAIDFIQDHCVQSFQERTWVISSSGSRENEAIIRKQRKATFDTDSMGKPFVLTLSIKRSFEMALLAVSQKWPILLHGPTGSGKTALIRKLAHVSGNQVLFLHMDEQMDGKTLIGSYISAEQPGEFRWQPGSLTQALLKGLWVVFEDIDKAPSEVQSFLLPLLEGARSYTTGRGEAINVAEGFRLFATVSSSNHDFSHNMEGTVTLGVLWRRLMVRAPSNKDMLDIINTSYPCLDALAEKLIDTFEKVNSVSSFQSGGFQVSRSSSANIYSRFSLRDLLKWCKRITGLGFSFSGQALPASYSKSIYQEAVDIFAASSASSDNRLSIMKEIAKMWGMPVSEAENFYPTYKPLIQNLHSDLQVGRITLKCTQTAFHKKMRVFVELRSSLHLLERIACSVKYNEPVLLVGETGTGKTTLVQNLAHRLGQPLTVLNLSQQSDVSDLLGGFKPTDARFTWIPLHKEFKDLFCKTFSEKNNEEFLHWCEIYVVKKEWKKLLHALDVGWKHFCNLVKSGSGTKRKRPLGEEIILGWESFSDRLDAARKHIGATAMHFSFVEGAFITALKNGHWILLDEVNLAPPETLQRVIGVLEGEKGSLCLAERGDVEYIHRHSSFRIFACMNPATDAGKRDLPYSMRTRFTEYFVDDTLNDEDLALFIKKYMGNIHGNTEVLDRIVCFYKKAKIESEYGLQDGANQKPQFSLRSLARALEYTRRAEKFFGFQKALYDGFCMFFLTLLDGPSAKIMDNMILSHLLGGNMPPEVPFDSYLMENKKFKLDSACDAFLDSYVLTKSIKVHLRNLARAVFIKRYPVLLQGPTSSGKTSLVQYLAKISGREFVRINNHEHTDLQEYFGSYITDSNGKLAFQEGVLVKAVRNGYWIVLDELNLAPSDVLEALNRLLDDNRELFVPELLETVSAHPDFMLFATQNPPTLYGGRKMLSRAFRNRFLEIHVDDIPEDELSTILEKRCKIPKSYAVKMVEVMKDLQLHRQNSKVFAGKHGFITPRDLFRWADRFRKFGNSYEDLAKDGYFLLAERLRDESEKDVVQEIVERRLRAKLVKDHLYVQKSGDVRSVLDMCKQLKQMENVRNIICTPSMWRLFFLIERCYTLREPVLLVGETGGGKTTVCQLLSIFLGSRLHTLNCHQYSETSDFLGGFYPVRDRSRLAMEFKDHVEKLKLSKIFIQFQGDCTVSSDIGNAASTLDHLNEIINRYMEDEILHHDVSQDDIVAFEEAKQELVQLQKKWQSVFMWQDGPLVQAMNDGDLFLVDEISLADDSVLERLNSVLEPERTLTLAEKGGSVLEKITAHPNFFLLATMNPGGDYGKKELSPALRNRFTEIWVPPVSDLMELKSIALERLNKSEISWIADSMLKFWEWFNQFQTGRMLTVRDLLSWVDFINATERNIGSEAAFIHGAFLVLLDGLSLGTSLSRDNAKKLRERCLSFLLDQLQAGSTRFSDSQISKMENYGWGEVGKNAKTLCHDNIQSDHLFGINPFYIAKGEKDCKHEGFQFLAPTTCRNALRVLRALQLPKPVLLEGSPGVGKTSLVVALANFSGHTVVRINLSEQTDIMDLLGSDLPVEGEKGMKFAWSDGILLQALKNGSWVLLDELNLAPQSVLEGLNAILDHRAEVYIPEIGTKFKCPPSFRVFACQNPSCQGGGRKGLPKSFLNRFTKVYVDELSEDDYLFICSSLYPSIQRSLLSKLIQFNTRLYEDTMLFRKYGQDGSPWEFNLRDVIRSCQIIESAPMKSKVDCFLNVVYIRRMRTTTDRGEVLKLYEEVFEVKPFINEYPRIKINPHYLIVGNAHGERNHFQPTKILKSQLNILPGIGHSLEAALHCVQHQWLCIVVGPQSSGKTSLVRLLSQLTGNALNELSLSPGTDISELLGCFEQYSAFRNFRAVVEQVERYIDEFCSLLSKFSLEALMNERKDLISRWFSFLSSIRYSSSLSCFDSSFVGHWNEEGRSLLRPLVEIIEQLKIDLEKYQLPVSWSYQDLNKSLKTIVDLQENAKMKSFSTKFEWVTGGLIKAIECGEWVVLENANLCNPTVLDRINSLVEPSGSITINECGLVDGKPVVLRAHPNFRMFLTVNPRYGEVSRAMRNRGVEVYMMQPYGLLNYDSDFDRKQAEVRDLKRYLVLSGIPISNLVDAIANAHIYSRDAGLPLGRHITFLELTRWVQLFQQLLMNGNRPSWSLHLSWEHTYLSSLGEAEGRDIFTHVKHTYLSGYESSKLDQSLGCSLALPGGWPAPLNLRNLLWCSKESCIKQNCMYLEFLGAQFASYKLSVQNNKNPMVTLSSLTSTGGSGITLLNDGHKLPPAIIPFHMLHCFLFPTMYQPSLNNVKSTDFDLALFDNMLFFAANWTIEQATESDLMLYFLWFKWYSSQLHPYCSFFTSFLSILEQERDHQIWNYILNCRRDITSHLEINIGVRPIPILSLELVELATSNKALEASRKRLYNAIQSVPLLRLSFQQWNSEDNYVYSEGMVHLLIVPALESLRKLEMEVLNGIVENACFDLYSNLLEHHTLFWKGITASQFECMLISWRSLKKAAVKLRSISPDMVKDLLTASNNLDKISSWNFHPSKSMLWVHGGHPVLPSSADVYYKMQQLVSLSGDLWPVTTKSSKLTSYESNFLIDIVLSANVELRYLAMQGVCMSSYITSIGEQDDTEIVRQLEEIFQMLLERFKYEKHNLGGSTSKVADAFFEDDEASACCLFSPEMLCSNPGFDSWLETLPLLDSKSFSLDLELLHELSQSILVDDKELYLALSNSCERLKYTLKFSLDFSSRSPTDFLSHQKILWILDAWTSVDSVRTKIASFVLEMWFKWHSSLWSYCLKQLKIFSEVDYNGTTIPCVLVKPTKTMSLDHIIQGKFPVKDYPVHCLKLRVASGNLWQDAPSTRGLPSTLLSVARYLFQQIIFAHEKSFEKDTFGEIKSIFRSIHENSIVQGKLGTLESLIETSSHHGLTDLIETFVKPLLRELYSSCPSYDCLYNLGNAWLHIGGLRFNLVLNPNDPDPAMKYAIKHSQIVEKISLLELEIKVRQECDSLVGKNSAIDGPSQRKSLLENLERGRRRLRTKVVFRPDPANFKKLKSECSAFMKYVKFSYTLARDLEFRGMNEQLLIEVCNWQETSTCFINRLSDEYAAYIDIILPVQVAVYEMKLGLSLVMSSALRKEFLDKVEEDNIDQILESILSFMQFPRGCASESISIERKTMQPEFLPSDLDASVNILVMDMNLLHKLFAIPRDLSPDKEVSILQLHSSIYHVMLTRVTHLVCASLVMDKASLMLLNRIFDQFGCLWMNMKVQIKAKEDDESQRYKFRPRAFKMEDILEADISQLRTFAADETLSMDWEGMLVEQDAQAKAPAKEHENLEEEWNVQNSILKSMVHVHNRLFGSENLVEHIGTLQVTDEEKLDSFMESYKLGTRIIKDMQALLSSTLDAKLVPEHLFYLCLEYKCKFDPPHKSYNFYKDSNAPALAKMVKPLTMLQEQVKYLMNEWPGHPGLDKILNIIEMLLALPLDTPLAKALFGLQFLVSRVQFLQENASKFSLSDQLQPIFVVVSSWKKLELDSWPSLLDGVLEQYEVNAGKLWFPLHSVLHRKLCGDMDADNLSTIQSIEEFIQTASVGEFKKRLGLLLAFHGQFNTSICLEIDSTPHLMENLKILYNVFGYYKQFLPLISEHIEASRRKIELELKEIVKLSHWEHSNYHLLIETSKRTRQKLWKIIQKFNDILEQPVMIVLNQEDMQKRFNIPTLIEQKPIDDAHDMTVELLPSGFDVAKFSEAERSLWYSELRRKIDSASHNLCPRRTSELGFPYICLADFKEVADLIGQSLSSGSAFPMYQEAWNSLEKICSSATEFTYLWKHESKNPKKKRALTGLMKLLEGSGLSKRKSMISEAELRSSQASRWFLQPSYDVHHLLLPLRDANISFSSHFQRFSDEKCDPNWEMANRYYFKNIALVQQIKQIRLNFHKSLSLEQVETSASFIDHLIVIQQDQRSVVYSFADHLKKLRKRTSSLKELGPETGRKCLIAPNQHATYKCMCQQKELFDSLYAMSKDASLLLRTVKNTHLNTCNSVRVEANSISVSIDRFVPKFQISKESLDQYLLGSNGVVSTPSAWMSPFIVSEQMENLVGENFQVINDFEDELEAFCGQNVEKSVKEPLLSRFKNIINKGKLMKKEFHSNLEHVNQSISVCEDGVPSSFTETYEGTIKLIFDAFQTMGLLSKGNDVSEESLSGNITLWKVHFETCIRKLKLDRIYDVLGGTIIAAAELVNKQPKICSQVEIRLTHLHLLLDLVLTFGDGLLFEFLAMHKTVTEMTHMLANIFALLYSSGFGAAEDQTDDSGGDKFENASGTGMGEGQGLNDVSDQIDDEDQLLGTSEKQSEGPDALNEVPGKTDKGIEMDEDFAADTFSVSEDSGDDDGEDGEDVNLDSVMGDTTDSKEIVDEKLWNKDEDGNPDNTIEQYESGPSVKETDVSSRELRAKEDSATIVDESEMLDNDKSDPLSERNESPNVGDERDDENTNDMMDKDAAFGDPTGIELNEEDMCRDEPEGSDPMEEGESDPDGNSEDTGDDNGSTNPADVDKNEENGGEMGGNDEIDESREHVENTDTDLVAASKEEMEPEKSDSNDDPILSADSARPMNVDNAQNPPLPPEIHWSNSSDLQNGLAPSRGMPSSDVPEMDITMPDSSDRGELTVDFPKVQFPQDDTSSAQKINSNPYRSIGNALEEWKERIKISDDSPGNKSEPPEEDGNANEYGFVSEIEESTSQALGPATSDQIDKNIKGNKPNADECLAEEKDVVLNEMEVEKENSETNQVRNSIAPTLREKIKERVEDTGPTNVAPVEASPGDDGFPGNQSGDLITIRSCSMNNEILQMKNLSVSNQVLGKAKDVEEISGDLEHNAAALWSRYELTTSRLSQELAEQLRLVMEPTLASKLQGDYKTGKRINMKKVIPYIASHFRKDKIWLRRTRPNKRDYQVVVAVDDSRSMSESHCGDVAIEALVTVCRAMSQLEVGQLAVASFGEKGNIKLLHDFDRPFNAEGGVKMISSLTFKQDNTIADEPVVDLLKYLNNKLDAAVANARLPSGQNPLQQLILIIADGRFHEKENLKRCVRDALSRKRMIAFLLLDSPQESIMDLMEASFQGETLSFTKYLNSFPFPYYIVLKNIEALPRTLADLLRQWFELMQNTRE